MRVKVFICVLFSLLLAVSGCGGKTKEELYAEGMKFAREGNANGAIVAFKNALEKDQNYFEARFEMGKAYIASGKYEQAEKELQKVAVQNPGNIEVQLETAHVYNKTNKPDRALEELDKYLKVKPTSAEALEAAGISHILKKDPAKAEEYFRRAMAADPQRTQVKLELIGVLTARGQGGEARKLVGEVLAAEPKNTRALYLLAGIEAAEGNRDGAFEAYRKIVEISPTETFARYRMGLAHVDKGELDKADAVAGELLEKFPKRPEGVRLRGLVQFRRQQYKEAITSLQNSIKLEPSLEAFYFLGLSEYNLGELESAISNFRTILDASPTFIQARLVMATILLSQNRIDDCISEMLKVVRQNDNIAEAHNILGSAYIAKRDYDSAEREFDKAIALNPKAAEAYMKMGALHLSQGKGKEAEADLTAAVKVAPDVANARQLLFFYYLRQKEYDKAVTVLQEALSGKEADAPLYNGMATARFAQGKTEPALEYLKKAKQADPSYLGSYESMAKYYASRSDFDNVMKEYAELLQRDPKNLRALLSSAAIAELKGQEEPALQYLLKAKETGNGEAFLALAGYHLKRKAQDKAIVVLDEAIKAIPGNIAAMEMKGKVLLMQKQYQDALKVFEDVRLINPTRGLTLKLEAYMAMNNVQQAMDQARQVTTLQPASALGRMLLASIYESQSDIPKAVAALKEGIDADKKNVQALMQLGSLYGKTKDYPAALKTFKDVLAIDPSSSPAYSSIGSIYEAMGQRKEAVDKYIEAILKNQDNVVALNNLANLYLDGMGKKEDALGLAVRAFKLEPSNPGILDTLGYALLKNGHAEQASKALERSVALLPGNPTILYHLALAYKEEGKTDAAVARLREATKLEGFPELEQAKRLLSQMGQ